MEKHVRIKKIHSITKKKQRGKDRGKGEKKGKGGGGEENCVRRGATGPRKMSGGKSNVHPKKENKKKEK